MSDTSIFRRITVPIEYEVVVEDAEGFFETRCKVTVYRGG
jgi:hypothetical protein